VRSVVRPVVARCVLAAGRGGGLCVAYRRVVVADEL
jgi:hypothetical protein